MNSHLELSVPGAQKKLSQKDMPRRERTALFVPTKLIEKLPFHEAKTNKRFALCTDIHEIIRAILLHGKEGNRYGKHGLESDPTKQQLIIYTVILSADGKSVLLYQRSTEDNDERLKKKYSIGFGGHIEGSDKKSFYTLNLAFPLMYKEIALMFALEDATNRELSEELGITEEDSEIHFIAAFREVFDLKKSPQSELPVEAMHTGVLAFAQLNSKRMQNRVLRLPKESFADAQWIQINALEEKIHALQQEGHLPEEWTKLVVTEFISALKDHTKIISRKEELLLKPLHR
jgi:predicted NUDIX family phosphoesterase